MSSRYSEYRYNSVDLGDRESSKRLADMIISMVRGLDGIERICDLGCGNGYLAGRLADIGYHVTGIDASQSGVELARKTYISDRIKFICAEIADRLPKELLNVKFDLVISSDVIEHLFRPANLIDTAFQILKPPGHLILGAPYHGYLKNLVLSILNRWDAHHGVGWEGGHIKFFSVKTLGSVISTHGFNNLSFHFYGRIPYLWKNMICYAQKY
jgi:2-polyprenyl-3-methyl-5-hydroxy-6-metoxy-1,4-benzoquinol methylase